MSTVCKVFTFCTLNFWCNAHIPITFFVHFAHLASEPIFEFVNVMLTAFLI